MERAEAENAEVAGDDDEDEEPEEQDGEPEGDDDIIYEDGEE